MNAEQTREAESGIDRLERFVDQAAEKHPELKLSLGYVGDLSTRHGDNRAWMVFTRLRRERGTGSTVTFDLGSTSTLLDKLSQEHYDTTQSSISSWLERLISDVSIGKVA